jgi:predicted amidohydrolase
MMVACDMRNFVLATASSFVSPSVRVNSAHIREMMGQARAAGARMIHFPEGALSGYVKSEVLSWQDVDWASVRTEIGLIAEEAKALGLWVIFGCNHQLTTPNLPHNSLYIISDMGELVDRYDKRLCSHAEINGWYSPGTSATVIEVDGYRFGLALCIEVQFPEVFMEYSRLGADAVLLSAYARDPIFHVLAQAYAAANSLWISVSTPAQCATDLPVAVFAPDGSLAVKGSEDGDPSNVITILDRENGEYEIALRKARPWRALAREGHIYSVRMVDDERSRNRRSF